MGNCSFAKRDRSRFESVRCMSNAAPADNLSRRRRAGNLHSRNMIDSNDRQSLRLISASTFTLNKRSELSWIKPRWLSQI